MLKNHGSTTCTMLLLHCRLACATTTRLDLLGGTPPHGAWMIELELFHLNEYCSNLSLTEQSQASSRSHSPSLLLTYVAADPCSCSVRNLVLHQVECDQWLHRF